MPYVVSVGLIVCDIITAGVEKDIFEKDTSYVEKTTLKGGGDAYNVAYNLAVLGVDSKLIGCVGSDFFGKFTIEQVEKAGVDVNGVRVLSDCTTSTSVILVEKSGERHIIFSPGANSMLSFDHVGKKVIENAGIVHLGSSMGLKNMDAGGTEDLFRLAHEKGAMTCMDATYDNDGLWLKKIERSLKFTDLFVPSFEEARALSRYDSPENIADFFKAYGIRYFVLKLGKDGCFTTDFNRSEYIKSVSKKVVDTTGAGDSFVAGMLSQLIKGVDIFESARFGQKTAARCVSRIGATGFDFNCINGI